jgi:hypothetical protein
VQYVRLDIVRDVAIADAPAFGAAYAGSGEVGQDLPPNVRRPTSLRAALGFSYRIPIASGAAFASPRPDALNPPTPLPLRLAHNTRRYEHLSLWWS